jgi:PTH1 family peptidyl-tRNA hydrolase
MEFKMIVGLGNPGPDYEHTYHNCGALMIEHLLRDRAPAWKHESAYSFVKEDGVLYIKPTTFMNESGRAVRAAADYYKIRPEHIAVLHDDADLELGAFKVRHDGGSGGHHGIDSIVSELGSETFWRVKIGIRRKPAMPEEESAPREKALDFVLRPISRTDLEVLYGVFAEAEKSLLNVMENEMP